MTLHLYRLYYIEWEDDCVNWKGHEGHILSTIPAFA